METKPIKTKMSSIASVEGLPLAARKAARYPY